MKPEIIIYLILSGILILLCGCSSNHAPAKTELDLRYTAFFDDFLANNCATARVDYPVRCSELKRNFSRIAGSIPQNIKPLLNLTEMNLTAIREDRSFAANITATINYLEIISEFLKKGYEIEYFPHGKIIKILKDGSYIFESGSQPGDKLLKYKDGEISTMTSDDVLDGERYTQRQIEIFYVDDEGKLHYFIGSKPIKRTDGSIMGYDYATHMRINEDSSLMAFVYYEIHEDYADKILSIQDLKKTELEFDIFNTLSKAQTYEDRMEAIRVLYGKYGYATVRDAVKAAPLYDIRNKKLVTADTFFKESFSMGSDTAFDKDPFGAMFNMVFGLNTAIQNPVTGEWIKPENSDLSDVNVRDYDFQKLRLDVYQPSNGIQIDEMCWFGNTLIVYGVLSSNDKDNKNIYLLNFNKNDPYKKITPQLIYSQKENYAPPGDIVCSTEKDGLFFIDHDGGLAFINFYNKEYSKIYNDLSSDELISNGLFVSFRSSNLQFVIK